MRCINPQTPKGGFGELNQNLNDGWLRTLINVMVFLHEQII